MADILGKKIGMTQVYDKDGNVVPVTVIEAGPCFIVNMRTKERDGYLAVQMGFGKKKHINKPQEGYLKKVGANTNFRYLREFRFKSLEGYSVGQEVKVDSFKPDEYITVAGVSIGKGFQGVVKRWHASRGPMSHGSKHHRLPGSSGSNTTPARVLKGKKRAGRMGGDRVTIKNLKVVAVDPTRNIMLVKGSVPGVENNFLMIRSTGRFVKAPVEKVVQAKEKAQPKAAEKAQPKAAKK